MEAHPGGHTQKDGPRRDPGGHAQEDKPRRTRPGGQSQGDTPRGTHPGGCDIFTGMTHFSNLRESWLYTLGGGKEILISFCGKECIIWQENLSYFFPL